MKTITISRQYGSGGRYIAALLSEKMGVPCYDSKFLPKEAERHGTSQEIINEFKGKTSLLYAIGVMMSEESQDKKRLTIPEKMFHAQKETVKRLAQEGPCIFVGRCADYVLGDYSNVINTFIYAYKDDRLNRIMDIYKLTEKQAADKIKKTDRERKLYYEARTGREWGGIESNSMLFNTSLLGIDGVTDALEAIYRKWESRG